MTGRRISQYTTLVWCRTPGGHSVLPDIKEHTHSHSESIQPYSGDECSSSYWCGFSFRSSIWHKSPSSLFPGWQGVAMKGSGFILTHREIRKRCKSPQRNLFMHQWSSLFMQQSMSNSSRSGPGAQPSMINTEVNSLSLRLLEMQTYCRAVVNSFAPILCLSGSNGGWSGANDVVFKQMITLPVQTNFL